MRALITGGTGKLGAAVAARLRREGWQVIAAGSRDGDLSRADDARALVERAVAELRGLDVVVNGASSGFEPKRFEDVSEEDLDAALSRMRADRNATLREQLGWLVEVGFGAVHCAYRDNRFAVYGGRKGRENAGKGKDKDG